LARVRRVRRADDALRRWASGAWRARREAGIRATWEHKVTPLTEGRESARRVDFAVRRGHAHLMTAPVGIQPALSDALASRYTITRELGQGGMATVFLARDIKHGRDVALKVLREEQSAALG